MVNFRVIHIKKFTRYLISFFIIISIIIFLIIKINPFKKEIIRIENELKKRSEDNTKTNKFNILNYSFLEFLKFETPIIKIENFGDNDKLIKRENIATVRGSDVLKRVINSEFTAIDNIEEEENIEQNKEKVAVANATNDSGNNRNDNEKEKTEENKKIELAKKEVKVEKVNERNIEPTYSITYDGVKIKNQSSYKLTDEILKDDYLPENKKDILIFHTHTCESYEQSEKYKYKMTGNYRTTDLNYSVAKVGDELTKQLEEYGFNVIHDKTVHDYPAYNGSYNRSLKTVQQILEENEDTDIVIDLHRDAVGDGKEYGPTVKIDGESVAQIMLVIGSDGGGLKHPNWKNNLKIAMRIQKKAEELYPGLFRPMIVRDSRYNQQVRDGAMIIEVGATANTLDESLASMKYLALILNEVFK